MRNNFRVTVSDGSIVIKDLDTDKVFMKYKSDDIVKSDLKFMLVAGGWGGSGHFHKVEPKGNFISKTIFKYFRFLGNNSIRMVVYLKIKAVKIHYKGHTISTKFSSMMN